MTNENTRKQIYNLLAAGIGLLPKANPSLFENKEQVNWELLLQLSKMQTIPALVWDGLLTLPKELHPERDVLLKWYALVLQTEKTNQQLNIALSEINRLITEELRLPYALLKGQGTAARYPNPLHRTCGDIDIFLGVEGGKAFDEAAEKMGLQIEQENGKHVAYNYKGVSIENHSKVTTYFWSRNTKRLERLVKLWEGKTLPTRAIQYPGSGAEVEEMRIPIAPSWFEAFFSVAHFEQHLLYSGIGLRHLCDWYILFQNIHEDEKTLYEEGLSQLRLNKIARAMEELFASVLGRENSLSVTARLIEQEIWRGGNFGFHDNSMGNTPYVAKKTWLTALTRTIYYLRRSFRFFFLSPVETSLSPLMRAVHKIMRS